jgi:hypothetical protein
MDYSKSKALDKSGKSFYGFTFDSIDILNEIDIKNTVPMKINSDYLRVGNIIYARFIDSKAAFDSRISGESRVFLVVEIEEFTNATYYIVSDTYENHYAIILETREEAAPDFYRIENFPADLGDKNDMITCPTSFASIISDEKIAESIGEEAISYLI